MSALDAALPIGVFDSGVGGLTVLNAIRQALPCENLLYLGDTARVPYGTKSATSVIRYAEQAAALLVECKIKLLVIACNTASAVAIEPLQALYPQLAVMGVIAPGAKASLLHTCNNRIGVIATEGTVNNQAYQKAILALNPQAQVMAKACSLFVALAEEGWHEGELVEQIITRYLDEFVVNDINPQPIDTLVLGCTHFPALKTAIANVLGKTINLVDSAETTATAVAVSLDKQNLLRQGGQGETRFLVTDGPERFARVAANFYNESIAASEIELVDIQHYSVP